MTIITAVCKDNQIAIASDTQTTSGNIKITAPFKHNHYKIIEHHGSYLGLSGNCSIVQVLETLLAGEAKYSLASRDEIFQWLLEIQPKLTTDYFVKSSHEKRNLPVESNQIGGALIINPGGIFSIDQLRTVDQYTQFWAIGSGQDFALGALNSLYHSDLSATEIAEAGVSAAAHFCLGCSLPIQSKSLEMW